jgi:hypothetical protein
MLTTERSKDNWRSILPFQGTAMLRFAWIDGLVVVALWEPACIMVLFQI